MYKLPVFEKTAIEINESTEGETIERKMERIVNNEETITDGAPSIYTERKDGVLPAYDIRTDRWDLALDTMQAAHRQDLAKRKSAIDEREAEVKKLHEKENGQGDSDGKTEPTVVQ